MSELENDSDAIKIKRRFAVLDDLDHFELMRDKIRVDAFNEFVNEIFNILINCK